MKQHTGAYKAKETKMSDSNKPLANLSMPTLRILKSIVEDACEAEGRREELGQNKAEFSVQETVTLAVEGTVKVSKSQSDAICAQKAEPWKLLTMALNEGNKQLKAAGLAGIDLKRIVELAENADPELVKKAKADTKVALKEIKDEVRGFRWGQVRVAGTVTKVTEEAEEAPEDLFVAPPADADEGAA
jgi:hypothetical protein